MITCKSCGHECAGNARACPRCGHRFTGLFGQLMLALLGVFILVAVLDAWRKPDPPAPPKTPQEIEDSRYREAEYGCERWTESNGKLDVDKVLGWSKLKTKSGVYAVRIEYRAKPLGLIMLSDCTFQLTDAKTGTIALVKASTRAE